MSAYAGIEKIDPIERVKQHELTKALWQQLVEAGIKTGYKGRIKGYLASNSIEHALEFKEKFQGDEDFEVVIYENEEDDSTQIIEITTPKSRLSLEALIELADILMIFAEETNLKFEGFELEINEIKKLNSPLWKFW